LSGREREGYDIAFSILYSLYVLLQDSCRTRCIPGGFANQGTCNSEDNRCDWDVRLSTYIELI
jgi:hypothetical protein